jgi:hypothetical protein
MSGFIISGMILTVAAGCESYTNNKSITTSSTLNSYKAQAASNHKGISPFTFTAFSSDTTAKVNFTATCGKCLQPWS